VIEFVDRTMTGEFRTTAGPSEKDALSHVPGHQQQISTPQLGRNQFDLQQQEVDLRKPVPSSSQIGRPPYRQTSATTHYPMKVRTHFIPVTPTSIMSNITLQFDRKDLQFEQKEGYSKAVINLYARVSG
jgi:hypothetical protein